MELRNNATFQIVGPSGSGKTHFVCKLLQNHSKFQDNFSKIYWHRGGGGESGLTNHEFCKLHDLRMVTLSL